MIPTGSMAPTLMGRHKEIACPQCGFMYAVNASQEAEARSANADASIPASASTAAIRPCSLNAQPSFKGDRILVMMFPYDLPFLPGSGPPERWDVVVFRYPEEPEVSYIKRLVGLPGETIRIYHGDVFVKSAGERQVHAGPQADAASVGDADHRLRRSPSAAGLERQGRVAAVAKRRGPAGRSSIPRAADTSPTAGANDEWVELRYRHLVPDPEQWEAIADDRTLPRAPAATLITDFYSYNTNMSAELLQLARRRSASDRKAHGCSPTGSAI